MALSDFMATSDKKDLFSTLRLIIFQTDGEEPGKDITTGLQVAHDILFLLGMKMQPMDGFASPITDAGEVDPVSKRALFSHVKEALDKLVDCRLIENLAAEPGKGGLGGMRLRLTDRGRKAFELADEAQQQHSADKKEQAMILEAQLDRMFRTPQQIDAERNRNRSSSLGR